MKLTAKLLTPILTLSIGHLLQAVPFNANVANGNWSDSNKWDLAAVPDTYLAGATANILGFTIDYDSGTTLAGGGLGIANGGSLTIDGAGSILTQLVNTQAIRVGEGTGGAGTGMGTLTISNGGAMNTGLAVGLAVGSQVGGGAFGNGELDVYSGGTLTMGSGASAGGLGVGLDGSIGVLKVGNLVGTSTVDLRANNILMAIGANQGSGGGNGTLNIDSTGVIDFGTNGIYVGQGAGSVGLVTNAGTIGTGGFATGEVRVGGGGGSGTYTQSAGSLTTTGEFNIGVDAGSVGAATISGGTVGTHQISVGRNGGTGTLTTSGNITTTGNNASVIVGNGGTGDLYISGGSLTVGSANNSNLTIGSGAGSLGHVHQTGGTVSYGSWVSMAGGSNTATAIWDISAGSITSGAGFEVGSDGVGTMNISGTANIAVNGFSVGLRTGSLGTVSMIGGTLASAGQVVVGGRDNNASYTGTGVFTVSAGTVSSVNETRVGEGTGATGTLNISGTTNWTSGGELQVGNDAGTGTMNMSGGTMTINQWGAIGRNGGTGVVNLSGGTIQMAGAADRTFDIGAFGGNGNPLGTGTLTQTGGALVNTVSDTSIGRDASGVGLWNMSAGTANLSGRILRVGNNGNGTANFTGGSFIGTLNNLEVASNGGSTGLAHIGYATAAETIRASNLYVGYGGGANGTANVTGGTLYIGRYAEIGRGGGTGTLNVNGANARYITSGDAGANQDFHVGIGAGSTGHVNVSNGGQITANWWVFMGRNGGTGDITVDGTNSLFTQTQGRLYLGEGSPGSGTITVSNNGTFNKTSGDEYHVGNGGGTTGTVNVNTNGLFHTEGEAYVGSNGSTGAVNIATGGTANINHWLNIGRDAGANGSGTVTQTGGSLIVRDELRIGTSFGGESAAKAVFNLSGGTAQSGRDINVGANNSSAGTLNISGTGVLHTTGGQILIGLNSPNGLLTMTGGSLTSDSSNVQIGVGGASGAGVATISGGTLTANQSVLVGNNPGAQGTLNLSGTGVVNSGNEWQVGNDGGIGVANISGGTVNAFSYVAIGRNTNAGSTGPNNTDGPHGGNGTVNLSGTGVISKVSGGGSFDIGSWNGGNPNTTNTSGKLIQTGGTVLIGQAGNNVSLYIGRDSGVKGTYTITGASIVTANNVAEFRVHNNGGAALDVMSVGGTGAFSLVAANQSAVGQGSGTGTGTLNITNPNAAFTFNDEFWVGNQSGTGALNMNAGSITANAWFDIGRNGGTGTVVFTGGTITKLLGVGNAANGTFDIGSSGGGTGTLTQSGSAALVNTANDTYVGRETSTGFWYMNGGTATLSTLMLGRDGAATGTWAVTNGTTTLTRLNVGNDGVGTFTMSGGSITASDRISLGTNGAGNGTATLSGGVATVNFVEAGAGTASLTLSGGTLKAYQDQADFIRGFTNAGTHSAVILSGPAGGVIDSNSHTITILAGNVLSGTKLTKTGNGVLNIYATQSYSTLETDGGVTNIYSAVGTGSSVVLANAATNFHTTSQVLASLQVAPGVEVTFDDSLPFADGPVKPAASFGGGAPGVVPEPASFGLLIVGALGLLARRRRSS